MNEHVLDVYSHVEIPMGHVFRFGDVEGLRVKWCLGRLLRFCGDTEENLDLGAGTRSEITSEKKSVGSLRGDQFLGTD